MILIMKLTSSHYLGAKLLDALDKKLERSYYLLNLLMDMIKLNFEVMLTWFYMNCCISMN